MNAFKLLMWFLLFASVFITVSYWIGSITLEIEWCLFGTITFFFLLSFGNTKFGFTEKIPNSVLFSALLVAGLCAFPLLLITPYYMGSNDAIQTITVRTLVMQNKIPATYEPYAPLPFNYQIGFHLFAKLFTILPFEDTHILWFFGVLLSFCEVILVYLVSKEVFNNEKVGIWSAILMIGTKTIFIDMYFGMFPRILATCFALAFIYFLKKKSYWTCLLLPTVYMVHPAMFAGLMAFSGVFLFFNRDLTKHFAISCAFIVLALPALLQLFIPNPYYEPFLPKIPNIESIDLVATALAIGLIPLILLMLSIFLNDNPSKIMPISVLTLGLVLMVGFDLIGSLSNIFVWIATLGAIWTIALFLEKHPKVPYVLVGVLLFAGFASSGYLLDKIRGSKITPQEAGFAFDFRERHPELATALFIGLRSDKVAELSNKIPFDTGGMFLPQSGGENAEIVQQMIDTNDVKKANELMRGVDYVVINTAKFPRLKPENEDYCFENFCVYQGKWGIEIGWLV